jgi:hypothetical protein
MAMGGGLAVSDRRYAIAARKQRAKIVSNQGETVPSLATASVNVEARAVGSKEFLAP